ncbi:hypothetical protein [Mesorhizobium sp. A623]
MRKFFLVLAGVAMMAGTSLAAAPAMARPGDHYQSQHHRPDYRGKRHHRQVCRTVVRKKVVWRHHRKQVVRYNVRRCHPVR